MHTLSLVKLDGSHVDSLAPPTYYERLKNLQVVLKIAS